MMHGPINIRLSESVYTFGARKIKQTTKAQMGSGGIVLLFLEHRRLMEVGGQSHVPASLPPGKARYSMYERLCGN